MFKVDERPVLIFDGLNTFVRAYAANPAQNINGEYIGGIVGTTKIISRLCSELYPVAVIMTWEGGGSARRRGILKEYKENRKPARLNRSYDDIPDSEQNRTWQLLKTIKLLRSLPIYQVDVTDCEGDDLIAHICKGKLKDTNKIIVSSDKDMHQLIDDRTIQYSPQRKMYFKPEDVLEQHHVSVTNFPLAKAICGDPGDNIPGVPGIGFKTASKLFPMLRTDERLTIDDIISYCNSHRTPKRSKYNVVLENEDVIRRNYRLVYLDGSMIGSYQAGKIDYSLEGFELNSNKFEFINELAEIQVNDFDVDHLYYSLRCLDRSNMFK